MLINSQCIEGNCITGFGKILYEDNSSYEGYFKDGLKNGKGTLIEYTDEYKITTEGLFVGDRLVQGEKVMKNLFHQISRQCLVYTCICVYVYMSK